MSSSPSPAVEVKVKVLIRVVNERLLYVSILADPVHVPMEGRIYKQGLIDSDKIREFGRSFVQDMETLSLSPQTLTVTIYQSIKTKYPGVRVNQWYYGVADFVGEKAAKDIAHSSKYRVEFSEVPIKWHQ